MTDRLYYHDSFLHEFDGEVVDVVPASVINARHGVVLNRTAFYPTSGGQVFDTGWIETAPGTRLRVAQVEESEAGQIVHYIEAEKAPEKGMRVRGTIDEARRRDHMQQHSGQHVLSAAFIRLFDVPTVSFHMGDDSCSIDLDTPNLTADQIEKAEELANGIIQENRPVAIKFVRQEEAQSLGLRKIPEVGKPELRVIDIQNFDLTACGGTHVQGTGQIGSILLRKAERARQGWRIEFVCGMRAVRTAHKDFRVLSDAAGLFSTHIWEVPQQIQKNLEEVKTSRKSTENLLEQLAELEAAKLLATIAPEKGRKVVVRVFQDREAAAVKLLAQKLTRTEPRVVALLGSTAGQPTLVFAKSPGGALDMGALLKRTLAQLGGRGGGSQDFAQGGSPTSEGLADALEKLAASLPD